MDNFDILYEIFINIKNSDHGLNNEQLNIFELFISAIKKPPIESLNKIIKLFNTTSINICQKWTHTFIQAGICVFHPNMKTPWSNFDNYMAFKNTGEYIRFIYELDDIINLPNLNIISNQPILNIISNQPILNQINQNNNPINLNQPLSNNDIPNFINMWPDIIQTQYRNVGWILIAEKINKWYQIPANNATPISCTWCKNMSLCCKSGNSGKKLKLCSTCWQNYW